MRIPNERFRLPTPQHLEPTKGQAAREDVEFPVGATVLIPM